MLSNFLQTKRDIVNSLFCTVLFSEIFSSVLSKENKETFCCFRSIACKRRRTDWILSIFSFNNKNSLYPSLILTFQFSEVQTRQTWTKLAIK